MRPHSGYKRSEISLGGMRGEGENSKDDGKDIRRLVTCMITATTYPWSHHFANVESGGGSMVRCWRRKSNRGSTNQGTALMQRSTRCAMS